MGSKKFRNPKNELRRIVESWVGAELVGDNRIISVCTHYETRELYNKVQDELINFGK